MNFNIYIDSNSQLEQTQTNNNEDIVKTEVSDETSPITTEEKIIKLLRLLREKNQVDFYYELIEEIEKVADVNLFMSEPGCEYSTSLLFHASREESLPTVEFLLERGADPTLVNNKGTSVLHLMAKRGQVEMAEKCWLKVPKDRRDGFLNYATPSGWTALMSAAENNQYNFVKWLLTPPHCAKVNFQMKTGWTAMHAAAKNNNFAIVRLLLKNGANKYLQAVHRAFGSVTAMDVAKDASIANLWRKY